eukprot:m.210553 g.210553  ORF g.210553 m.210553 type:complete len:1316 (-) comp15556_c1_seq5:26-3973(-)
MANTALPGVGASSVANGQIGGAATGMSSDLDTLCVWGLGHCTKKGIWSHLREDLPLEVYARVLKLTRAVQSSDGFVRFDILLDDRYFASANKQIAAACRRLAPGIHARPSIPFEIRASASANNAHSNQKFSPKIVSVNVNSMSQKLDDIVNLISTLQVDILLLQETMRVCEETQTKLFFHGYRVLERSARPQPRASGRFSYRGARGLAIIFRESLPLRVLPNVSNDYFLAAAVRVGPTTLRCASIYVPQAKHHHHALPQIQKALAMLKATQTPGCIDLIAGDFNKSAPSLVESFLPTALNAPYLAPIAFPANSAPTFVHRNGESSSTIDHFVAAPAQHVHFSTPAVLPSFNFSDHHPISIKAARPLATFPARRMIHELNMSLDKKQIPAQAASIRNHNYWSPLEECVDTNQDAFLADDDLAEATNGFLHLSQRVADDTGVVSAQRPTRKNARGHLTKKTQKLIDRSRSAKHALNTLPAHASQEQIQSLTDKCKQLKNAARLSAAADRQRAFRKFVVDGASALKSNPGKFYKFLASASHYKPKRTALATANPVVHPTTEILASSETEAVNAWTAHYAQLLTADPAMPTTWEECHQHLNMKAKPTIENINGKFSWAEVCEAAASMPGFKATGPTGVQVAWLKLACDKKRDGVYPEEPQSSMGKTLFYLCNSMFLNHSIPERLTKAFIVSIHKAGDATNTNNYRGISLIDSILKLVTTIVNNRLQREAAPKLTAQQAGFRKGSECMGHVAALIEICCRQEEPLCPVFIDLKKAFDMVPHGVLLYKLERFGIRGNTLEFLKALYSNSTACVRNHISGNHGNTFSVTRGVRQGDPLSPFMFNIFINDVFNGFLFRTAALPAGLLFADDMVLLSRPANIQSDLQRLEEWLVKNGMSANASKCGVMAMHRDKEAATECQNQLRVISSHTPFILCGSPVPVVDSYVYLGVHMHFSLDHKTIADARANAVAKPLKAVASFCANRAYPLAAKVKLINSVAIPKTSYGGEVVGMNKAAVARSQSLVNKCVRQLCLKWGKPAADMIRLELDMPSLYAITTAARARALYKYQTRSKADGIFHVTTIHVIADKIAGYPGKTKKTWVTTTRQWLNTNLKHLVPELDATHFSKVFPMVRKEMMGKDFLSLINTKTKAINRYRRNAFFASRSYLSKYISLNYTNTLLDAGVAGLIACRTRAIWLAPRAVKAGLIDPAYAATCPCCETAVRETLTHLMLECPAWTAARTLHLTPLIRRLTKFRTLSADMKVAVLLGGNTRNVAHGRRTSFGKRWFSGKRPLFLNVALFLGTIYARRNTLLWSKSLSAPGATES